MEAPVNILKYGIGCFISFAGKVRGLPCDWGSLRDRWVTSAVYDDRGDFLLGSKPSGTHEVSSSLFPPIGTSPSQSPRAIRNASTMNGIKFMMIRVIIILYL